MPASPLRRISRLALTAAVGVSLLGSPSSSASESVGRPSIPKELVPLLVADTPEAGIREVVRNAVRRATGQPLEDPWYGEVWVGNAGDLDGDGSEDALEERYIEAEDERTFEITALRHGDGHVLWSLLALDYAYALPAGDLDDQAGSDVVLFEAVGEYTGAGTDEAWAENWSAGTVVRAVRGRDATSLWAIAAADLLSFAYGPTVAAGGGAYSYPLGAPADLDGDGARDLLLAVVVGAYAGESVTDEHQFKVRTAFVSVSGRTGRPIAAYPGNVADGFPTAAMLPDVSGDGLTDVVVLAHGDDDDASDAVVASAYPGKGGQALWRSSLDLGPGYVYEVHGARVDGDALGDALIGFERVSCDEEDCYFHGGSLSVVSGSAGQLRWTRAFGYGSLWTLAGDSNGDGGQEVLFVSDGEEHFFGFFSRGPRLPTLLMARGSDGRAVWARNVSRLDDVDPAGDVTGDGIADAVVESHKRVPRTNRKPGQSRFRTVRMMAAYSGRSGGRIWTRAMEGDSVRALLGDLNGDRRQDLQMLDRSRNRYVAVSGRSGGRMWRRWATGAGYSTQIIFARTGSTGGLFEFGYEGDEESGIYSAARRGDNGTARWRRSVAFD